MLPTSQCGANSRFVQAKGGFKKIYVLILRKKKSKSNILFGGFCLFDSGADW